MTHKTDADEGIEPRSLATVTENRALRLLLYTCGVVLVGLGFIGAVLPLMPATVFFILAAACFARSSPAFEAWITNHPHFGPHVHSWRAHGAIAKSTKRLAFAGISISFVIIAVSQMLSAWGLALVAAGLSAVLAWILSRPEPPTPGSATQP